MEIQVEGSSIKSLDGVISADLNNGRELITVKTDNLIDLNIFSIALVDFMANYSRTWNRPYRGVLIGDYLDDRTKERSTIIYEKNIDLLYKEIELARSRSKNGLAEVPKNRFPGILKVSSRFVVGDRSYLSRNFAVEKMEVESSSRFETLARLMAEFSSEFKYLKKEVLINSSLYGNW